MSELYGCGAEEINFNLRAEEKDKIEKYRSNKYMAPLYTEANKRLAPCMGAMLSRNKIDVESVLKIWKTLL